MPVLSVYYGEKTGDLEPSTAISQSYFLLSFSLFPPTEEELGPVTNWILFKLVRLWSRLLWPFTLWEFKKLETTKLVFLIVVPGSSVLQADSLPSELPGKHSTMCCYFSVAQSCPTLCNPMDCSMPGFPVLRHLSEFAQTHVLWVGDAIQPSHPLSSPFPPAFNLSQHQGPFQWVSSSYQVAKVLEFQFSISPSNKYSGLISFRIDWYYLLVLLILFIGHQTTKYFVIFLLLILVPRIIILSSIHF